MKWRLVTHCPIQFKIAIALFLRAQLLIVHVILLFLSPKCSSLLLLLLFMLLSFLLVVVVCVAAKTNLVTNYNLAATAFDRSENRFRRRRRRRHTCLDSNKSYKGRKEETKSRSTLEKKSIHPRLKTFPSKI